MGILVKLFPILFSDSQIAHKLQLQKDKVAYTISYGIAPIFVEDLMAESKTCDMFTVGFDECLNKVSVHQQMDLFVKFWHSSLNEVQTRYLTSVFLGKTAATNLQKAFCNALSGMNLKRLVQVSMDGPNINLRFLKDLRQQMRDEGDPGDGELIDFGTCGLHVVHGAFKKGCKDSGWELIEYLRSLYNLFKFVPARRADFITITESSVFPKKFCAIRWVENREVAARAISIQGNVKCYVDRVVEVESEQLTIRPKPPLTIAIPDCMSFEVVKKALQDELLLAKLTFFEAMACEIEPFLREFQSSKPLAPFLYTSLQALLREFQRRFVKEEALTGRSPEKVDVNDKGNLLRAEDVQLGFATTCALRKCNKNKQISEKNILDFRKGCLRFLIGFVEKMLEKSPLRYSFARAVTCLDPQVTMDTRLFQLRTECALKKLTELNRIPGRTADAIFREFKALVSMEHVKHGCQSYNRNKMRLDHFWMQMIGDRTNFENFKLFVKLLCILFHGNADLERGFSINKECLVENLREDSLVALRTVYDAVQSAGGIEKVVITKRMILSARNASSRRKEMLVARRTEKEAASKSEKRKKEADAKIRELKAKKLKLLEITEKEIALLDEEVQDLKGQT